MFVFDFQSSFIVIFLCFSTIICYSFIFKKPKKSRGFNLPPSPPSLPIIGHLHLLLTSSILHKSLQKISSKYGLFLHLRIFNFPILLVTSPSMAYEIYKSQDLNVSFRTLPTYEGSLFLGTSSIITVPYDGYYKSIRKLIAVKLLGPHALERSLDIRNKELEGFYSTLLVKANMKERVDVGEEVMKVISKSFCKMLMGRSFSGESEKVRSLVTESEALTKKFFLAAMFRSKPFERLKISLFKKELTGISTKYDELLERIFVEYENKLDEHHQGNDMMDLLLKDYGDENAEYTMNRHQIKSLFVDLLAAGMDTSAQAIQWIMAEIINNSYVLERLREEIDSVVGKTRLIQEEDIPNLPYMQGVVKEGLRLHPPAPIMVRTFQEDCNIGSFYVPGKTTLVVNVYTLMRDPDIWDEPEVFKPERFLASLGSEQKEKTKEVLKYLSFGNGRRGCPGSNLANVFVGTMVGVMVQCFDWRMKGEKVNMDERGGKMTLQMTHPIKCTPVVRTLIHLPSTP